jgi:hypothetical protein
MIRLRIWTTPRSSVRWNKPCRRMPVSPAIGIS